MPRLMWFNIDKKKPTNKKKYRIANADKSFVVEAFYSEKASSQWVDSKGKNIKFKVQYWATM